jgi:hypothetical protein
VGGDLGELDVDPARDRIGPIAGNRLLRSAGEHDQREDDRYEDKREAASWYAHHQRLSSC